MNTRRAALLCAGITAAPLFAQVPTYSEFEIQASTSDILFNLPSGSSISSVTPRINALSQVAFKYLAPNTSSVWFGTASAGQTIHAVDTSIDFYLVSDPDLNTEGRVVWAQDGPGAPAVWSSLAGAPAAIYATGPLGTSFYGSPSINALGQVGYRAEFATGKAWASFAAGAVAIHAAEQSIQPGTGISFLFTPFISNSRQIAGKMTRQTFDHEEIRLVDPTGVSTLIAQTNNLDPQSIFDRFDNSVGVNASRQVSFTTTLVGGDRAVYRADAPGLFTNIAREGVGDISDIEFFASVLNDNGLVAFRAFDAAGKRAAFVGDGAELRKVAVEGTPIIGPTGQSLFIGRFIDSSPAFGGGVDINERGDIVFNAQLHDTITLRGAAIVVAFADAPCPADITGEGELNTNDFFEFLALYQAGDSRADFSPGGGINTNDFFAYLAAYQAGC